MRGSRRSDASDWIVGKLERCQDITRNRSEDAMIHDRAGPRTGLANSGGKLAAHPVGGELTGSTQGWAAAVADSPGHANVSGRSP